MIAHMGIGAAVMAILVAATSYASPMLRCVNEKGTVWVGAPVEKCYRLADVFPESAFSPAR